MEASINDQTAIPVTVASVSHKGKFYVVEPSFWGNGRSADLEIANEERLLPPDMNTVDLPTALPISSERMVASAYKLAVEAGFKPNNKVEVAFNLPTAKQLAGETMFVMRSGSGASQDPYANRAQMPTSEALAASLEQQYIAASQARDMQEQMRLQELAQTRDSGLHGPNRGGPAIS
ncbi:XVIPCD domain-containing protein [Xanthomonas sp. LMG 12460]|uniref:XVIPCD domain-containing protein n=1 Tax=Xanthomonas sp. LMG 12460 TaxID=1591132 RepID=UPI001D053491|nr:XVIPCD domain-containing protein [Xanthomonas sp. LMG 12460]